MREGPLASIIVNNYNYGRFLADAIESALHQTYSPTEIIVVDDGSTDESREIIARYGSTIIPVLKENGGQGSAFNAGFAVSGGKVILFLDADDMLLPTAVATAVESFDHPDVVKVHWCLFLIDEHGKKAGGTRPGRPLPQGDLRDAAFRVGPTNYLSAPTSGNAWSRRFLHKIFPVPESVYRTGADTYLFELAPFFGIIKRIESPLSLYRQHGQNLFSTKSLDAKLRLELTFYDNCCEVLSGHFQAVGAFVNVRAWRRHSWWHRLDLAIREIAALPGHGGAMILVDDATWDPGPIAGRPRLPFLEKGGVYWGNPSDDDMAVRELERLRRAKANLLVFVWPAFWWLEHYPDFLDYVRTRFPCLLANERVVAFNLTGQHEPDQTPSVEEPDRQKLARSRRAVE
jgi:glycosyltransferase involved in cell wall biosynthesis